MIIAIVSVLSGAGAVTGGLAVRSRSRNGSDANRSAVDRELRRREDSIRREAQLEVAVTNLTKALDALVKESAVVRRQAQENSSKLQGHEIRISVLERDTTGPHRTVEG